MAELEDESNGDDDGGGSAGDGGGGGSDGDGGGGGDGGSDGGGGADGGSDGGGGDDPEPDASCAPLIDSLSGYNGSRKDTTGTAEYKDATDNWWVFHGDGTVVTVPNIMHTYSSNSTDSGYNLPVSKPWTCGNIDVVYLWYLGGTNGETIQGYFVSDFDTGGGTGADYQICPLTVTIENVNSTKYWRSSVGNFYTKIKDGNTATPAGSGGDMLATDYSYGTQYNVYQHPTYTSLLYVCDT
jgi:hypothetical protein